MNQKIGFNEWVHFYWLSMLLLFTCFMPHGYILSMVLNMFFHGKTISYQYVLGWWLYQDKPYGIIILTTKALSAYNNNYKLWSLLSSYIWTLTKILYKQQIMFWIFGCFDIVTIIFLHEFCMLYNVWLSSCHPCDLTILLFFSITSYPIRKNICQVINLQLNQDYKREQNFGKSSIRNQSRL